MTLYNKINRLVAKNSYLPDTMYGTNNCIYIKYEEPIDITSITSGNKPEFKNLYLLIKNRLDNKADLYNHAEIKVWGESHGNNATSFWKIMKITANSGGK
tara:strand:+ start:717 stop:1016 length:300 start_codon:yes stop_codon:yes gene_type:complete